MELYLNEADPREVAAVCAAAEAEEHAAYLAELEDWFMQDSPQTRHPGRSTAAPRPSAIALREARAALPAPAPAPELSPERPDALQIRLLTRYGLPIPATFIEAARAIRAHRPAPVSPVAVVAAPAVEAGASPCPRTTETVPPAVSSVPESGPETGVSFMARLEAEISLLTATNERMSADEAAAWKLPRAIRQAEAARLCDLRQPTAHRLCNLRDLHEALTGRVWVSLQTGVRATVYIPATPAPDADLDTVAATVAAEIKRLAH